MKIGELAKRAGVNIQTIRFYERERVLRAAARTASGYRSYADRDLQHVVFVKQCQQLGFTLAEIRQLASLHQSLAETRNLDAAAMDRFTALAQERLQIIDAKIAVLGEMRRNLDRLLKQSRVADDQCPGQKTQTRSQTGADTRR
jgi:DNA-binding transcriptional MerR regulator